MRQKFLKLFCCCFLVILFLINPNPVFAASNFTTNYHVTYTVAPNGITHAVLTVVLTNTTSQYYASSYKMQLGFDNITNVSASDPDGPINVGVNKTDEGYLLDLTFNKRAVGVGSALSFTLSFDTPSIAKQIGKVWEINIPGLSNPNDFQSFVVDVHVPPSFGKPAYTKPYQPNTAALSFTKDQLGKSGISIAFGDNQLYAFHLTYHLKNPNVYPVKTEVALPPSTNYQDVYITAMDPQPNNVTVDKDGNWLAQYTLAPSQQIDVLAEGKVKVNLYPKQQILSNEDFNQYLAEKQYWEVTNNEIQTLAHQLKTPDAIYNYVVKTLHYDFTRVTEDKPRLGAAHALQTPDSAACREFTDLFIALARAAGIPAREVDGFAYTENPKEKPLSYVKDILHAWPEYYDTKRKTWIMVDPTWGSTTGGVDYFSVLDYDHVAFVIKGQDSNVPVAAGGYKGQNPQDNKDVKVGFTDNLPPNTLDADVTTDLPDSAIAGLPISGKMQVKNIGSGMIPAQIMYMASDTLLPHDQTVMTPDIPPFGYATMNIHFNHTGFLTNNEETFTIRLADKTNTETITVAPFYLTTWGIGGIIIGILTIIICILAYRFRRVRLSRKR